MIDDFDIPEYNPEWESFRRKALRGELHTQKLLYRILPGFIIKPEARGIAEYQHEAYYQYNLVSVFKVYMNDEPENDKLKEIYPKGYMYFAFSPREQYRQIFFRSIDRAQKIITTFGEPNG